MIQLLIQVLVAFLVFGLIWYIVDRVAFFAPFRDVARAVIAVFALIYLLLLLARLVGVGPAFP